MEAKFQEEINALKELIESLESLQKSYLSLDEAARYLGVSKSCIYKKTSEKEIAHYKPGGKLTYLRRTDLDNWIEQGYIPTTVEELNNLGFNAIRKGGLS